MFDLPMIICAVIAALLISRMKNYRGTALVFGAVLIAAGRIGLWEAAFDLPDNTSNVPIFFNIPGTIFASIIQIILAGWAIGRARRRYT